MRRLSVNSSLIDIILKFIFAVLLCFFVFVIGINNIYTEPYVITALVGVGIAVVLLIIYSFVDGREYLRIAAYVLFAIAYLICMVILIFVSEYDEPYNQGGRYRPIMSGPANSIVRTIREDLSADKIFDFDEAFVKEENDDNYKAHIITFFERYDIDGHIRNEYKSDNEQIEVSQEYRYFDRIVSDNEKEVHANWLKSKYLRGFESGDAYKFSEDNYIIGEKDGIEYQYMYKRLSGNVSYFIVYMQDEDTFFAMRIRIKSQDRLNLDKEKAMENILSSVHENGIMKTAAE